MRIVKNLTKAENPHTEFASRSEMYLKTKNLILFSKRLFYSRNKHDQQRDLQLAEWLLSPGTNVSAEACFFPHCLATNVAQGVSKIFDYGRSNCKLHAITCSEIFEKKNFSWNEDSVQCKIKSQCLHVGT